MEDWPSKNSFRQDSRKTYFHLFFIQSSITSFIDGNLGKNLNSTISQFFKDLRRIRPQLRRLYLLRGAIASWFNYTSSRADYTCRGPNDVRS
jgi:hypothetical protein